MPFVIMARTDIPDGVLQLTELKPNDSQRNYIYETEGQTQYVKNIPTQSTIAVTGAGPITTNADYVGLAAYLVDHVENQTAGESLTPAIANAAGAAIVAAAQAGTVLDSAAIVAILVGAGAGAGTGVDTFASTGSVEEVLGILAGRVYLLPGGSTVEDGGNLFVAAVAGSFTNDGEYKQIFDTSAFKISNGAGQIANFKAATFNYADALGAALSVYADDGTVL